MVSLRENIAKTPEVTALQEMEESARAGGKGKWSANAKVK